MGVTGAPTTFGTPLEYTPRHDESAHRVVIDIPTAPPGMRLVYPCRLGGVTAAHANDTAVPLTGADVQLPAGTTHAEISYR